MKNPLFGACKSFATGYTLLVQLTIDLAQKAVMEDRKEAVEYLKMKVGHRYEPGFFIYGFKKYSRVFKIVDIALIAAFCYQQILYAADFSFDMPGENDKNRSGFMSGSRLDAAQARQEALIKRLDDYLEWKIANGYAKEEDWNLKKKTGALAESINPAAPAAVPNDINDKEAELSVTT